jgi:hypothetical protein
VSEIGSVDSREINLPNLPSLPHSFHSGTSKESSLLISASLMSDIIHPYLDSKRAHVFNVFDGLLTSGLGFGGKASHIQNTKFSSLADGLICSPCFTTAVYFNSLPLFHGARYFMLPRDEGLYFYKHRIFFRNNREIKFYIDHIFEKKIHKFDERLI